jgi:hypothetical protein
MKRRAAVEPAIGHVKAEHRVGRIYLKGRGGDRINALLAIAGYNFARLLRWFSQLLRTLFRTLFGVAAPTRRSLKIAANRFFTDDHRYRAPGDPFEAECKGGVPADALGQQGR